jgi:foldase protein PrsA
MNKTPPKGRANGSAPKKKLIRTRRETTIIKISVTIATILIIAVVYLFIDSRSYVAKVDQNRISKAEYSFFLTRQLADTEYREGLITQEEKDKFWTTPVDGQIPWETAKREALNMSKDYMIQLIKAHEAGMKVNSEIMNEVSSAMTSLKGQATDKQFYDFIKSNYRVTPNELGEIYGNIILIDRFKESYIEKNFNAEPLTDEDLRVRYDQKPELFDRVDIRYISFYKFDEENNTLPQEQIDAKTEKAEEALEKIKQGEDIDKVIAQYTEDKFSENVPEDQMGKATLTYIEGKNTQKLIDWVFSRKPGDYGIVEDDYIIYVVKIEDRTSFDDVKDIIKTTMETEAKEKFFEEALQSWRLEPQYNIITNGIVYESISYSDF